MKQNMWFVLAEWLSSVNANDEIKKYTCRPTKRKCKLAQAQEEKRDEGTEPATTV